MSKSKKSVGFRTTEETKSVEMGYSYPTLLEVPEDYWTMTTTADNFDVDESK